MCDASLPVATSVGQLYCSDLWKRGNLPVIFPHYGLCWFILCMFCSIILLCWNQIAERLCF